MEKKKDPGVLFSMNHGYNFSFLQREIIIINDIV